MRSDIYWMADHGWQRGLATSARPRGGDWLEDEVASWLASGVTHVVSMLEPDETSELELEQEAAACRAAGLRFTSHPVPDRSLPESAKSFSGLAAELYAELRKGGRVLVHCRQGIGRASLLATAVLTEGGLSGDEAFAMVARARGRSVPDTEDQRAWLLEQVHARAHRPSA